MATTASVPRRTQPTSSSRTALSTMVMVSLLAASASTTDDSKRSSVYMQRISLTITLCAQSTLRRGPASRLGFRRTAAVVAWVVSLSRPLSYYRSLSIPDASDLLFDGMQFENGRKAPLAISQCTTFSGADGNCTSSQFELENLVFRGLVGTSSTENVATFQCSGVKPCHNITIVDTNITVISNNTVADGYLCGNVQDTIGWNCTGQVCVGSSADGGC